MITLVKNPICDVKGKIYCYNKATLSTAADSSTVGTVYLN